MQSCTRQIPTVGTQRHVLHGGEGEQLHKLPDSVGEKGQGQNGALAEFDHRHEDDAQAVRRQGEKGEHVNQHGEGHGDKNAEQHGTQEPQKAFRSRWSGKPVGSRNEQGDEEDGNTAQRRFGKPVCQASCVPHGIDADGTHQFIGDVSVQNGTENLIFHDPSHEKSEKGLLQPDVGTGGLQGHGKGRRIGFVKGAQGEHLHDAPHELGDHSGDSGGTVLHAHIEPETEKGQIFFHKNLRSEALMHRCAQISYC